MLPSSLTRVAEVRGVVDQCNTALASQPALAEMCAFAEDLKAISKLAGTNAVAVGRLMKSLEGAAGQGWRWVVSEYRCFPVLAPAVVAAGSGRPLATVD